MKPNKVTRFVSRATRKQFIAGVTVGCAATFAVGCSAGMALADAGSPWVYNMSNPHADGLVIHGTTGTNNPFIIYDHMGQPIMAVADAGGEKVFGDCDSVNLGSDIYNSQITTCPWNPPTNSNCIRANRLWIGGTSGDIWKCKQTLAGLRWVPVLQ